MSVASEMLATYPKDLGGIDTDKLAECIDACFTCAQACTACADACLSEEIVAELAKCIRTDLTAPTSVARQGGCCRGTLSTTPT